MPKVIPKVDKTHSSTEICNANIRVIVANNNKYRFFKKEKRKKKYFPRKKQFQISSISYRDTTSLNSNRSRSTATGTIVGGSGGGGGGGGSPHPRSPSTDVTTDRSEKSVHLFDVSTFDPCLMLFDSRGEGRSEVAQCEKRTHANERRFVLHGVRTVCNVEIFIGRLRVTNTV